LASSSNGSENRAELFCLSLLILSVLQVYKVLRLATSSCNYLTHACGKVEFHFLACGCLHTRHSLRMSAPPRYYRPASETLPLLVLLARTQVVYCSEECQKVRWNEVEATSRRPCMGHCPQARVQGSAGGPNGGCSHPTPSRPVPAPTALFRHIALIGRSNVHHLP
jgi:hypothetical protein